MLLGLIAEQFLNDSASQLTSYGVIKILETMQDGQMAVFFRNNHFSTIFKKEVYNKFSFDWILFLFKSL